MPSFQEKVLRSYLIYVFSVPLHILLTPVRLIFDGLTIYYPDFFRPPNNPENHNFKVKQIQQQVARWNMTGRKNLMCTGRPAWQTLSIRSLNKTKFTQINLDLEDIIEINEKSARLRVEPGMKMGTLTYKLLAKGWTIPVIPEFESLTVGGCVNGTGIETSSHKYGLFADACQEFEIVLPDGTVRTCSKVENSNLFYAIPWSHGTIGFLTSVTIELIKAPKFIKIEYHPTRSITEAKVLLQKTEYDFIEGIMYGMNGIVVMLGKMVDNVSDSKKINYINRWYKPWFYKHVEAKLKTTWPTIEYVPARDYYHRHQRSYFWEVAIGMPQGNSFLFRLLFGWIFPLNFQLVKAISPEYMWDLLYGEKHVLQDFLIPMSKLEDALHLAHSEVEVYPIWLCPCKFFKNPGLAHISDKVDEMYIDVGIYGLSPKTKNYDQREKIRKLENFALKNNGFQFLYADTFMTRDEFRSMFDMSNYEKIIKKFRCKEALPEIYDKISRAARQ